APIRTGSVAGADLSRYTVLLVADGRYARSLGAAGRAAISTFANNGGVVVVMGEALTDFNAGDNALFALARETVLGGDPDGEDEAKPVVAGAAIASDAAYRALIADGARRPDTLPGALLNTAIDADNFLSAGYDQASPVVFASGDLVFAPLSRVNGVNVV